MKQFKILQKKGFKLYSNWQQLNNKSIYFLGTKSEKNFNLYVKKALKNKCKYIYCSEKFKNINHHSNIKFFYYKSVRKLTRKFLIETCLLQIPDVFFHILKSEI